MEDNTNNSQLVGSDNVSQPSDTVPATSNVVSTVNNTASTVNNATAIGAGTVNVDVSVSSEPAGVASSPSDMASGSGNTAPSSGDTVKLSIDKNVCLECGMCAINFPDWFSIKDDGSIDDSKANVPADKVEEVMDICSVGAIGK